MEEQSTKAKQLGLREYWVHMGLFDFTVLVVTGESKKLNEYLAWKYEDGGFDLESLDRGYECRGRCFYKKGYVPIVWVPRKPRTAREQGTFAHECTHAVFHMFEWAGLSINRETEEVMTHSIAHLIASVNFK